MNSIHYGYNNNNGKSGSTTSRGRTESPASRVKYPPGVLGHQKQAQQLHSHHQYTTDNNHQSLINRSSNTTTANFGSSMGANKSSSVMNKQTLLTSNKFYTSSVSNPTSVNVNEYYTQPNNRLVAMNGNLNRRNLNLSSNKTIFESTVISNNNYPFMKSNTVQPSAQQINSNKSSKHLSTINKLNMNNLNEDMNSLNLNAGTNSISLYASKNKYQEDYYVDNSKLIRTNQKITNENSNGPSQFFAAKSSNISSSSTSSSSSSTSSSSSSSPPLPNNLSYLHRKSSQNVAAAVGANDNNFDDLNSKGLAGLKNLGNTVIDIN